VRYGRPNCLQSTRSDQSTV